jgi:hypothetical protein
MFRSWHPDAKEEAKGKKKKYLPERFENGDTGKEL